MSEQEKIVKTVKMGHWQYDGVVLDLGINYHNFYEADESEDDYSIFDTPADPRYFKTGFVDNWQIVFRMPNGDLGGGMTYFSLEEAVEEVENKLFKNNFLGWIETDDQ